MKILIVEDDPLFSMELEAKLTALGHRVSVARDAKAGIELGVLEKPDIVISDWNLEDTLSGVGVCNAIQSVHPRTQLIIVSGSPRDYIVEEAKDVPILTILSKPVSDGLIRLALQSACTN